MPSSPEALTLSSQYRVAQVANVRRAVRTLQTAWGIVDLDRLGETVASFARFGANVVDLAQREAVRQTDAYLANYLTLETADLHLPTGVDPFPFLGNPSTDASVEAVLASSAAFVRLGLEQKRPDADALGYGFYRAARFAGNEIVGAGRRALAGMASEGPFKGWRRMTSANPCPICRGLADGSVMPFTVDPSAHPQCTCTAVPVVRGVPDTHNPATAEDLADADG